jgi:hypothetical protein
MFTIALPTYSLTGAKNTLFEFYLASYINNEPSKNELIQEIMSSRGIEEVNYKISKLILKISENNSLTADQKDSLINTILGSLYPEDLESRLMKNTSNKVILTAIQSLLNLFGFNYVTNKVLKYILFKTPDVKNIKILSLSSYVMKNSFIPKFDKNTKDLSLKIIR